MATHTEVSPTGYRDLFRAGRAQLSLAITLTLMVATLDVLIVATAMPTILDQLGDVHLYSWSFSAYTLASIATLPIFSALTGRWGLLPTMALSLAFFVAGSVLAALAGSMLVLVLGRAVQGVGAGGLFGIPFIIISNCYPSSLQPRALALTSGIWGISSLTGPLIGALLLQTWGWPAIFWVNLPICAVVMLLGYLGLRATSSGGSQTAAVNLVSPLLLTLATGLLLAAPTASGALALLLVGLGLAAAMLYALAERRSAQPVVPPVAWRAAGSLGAALAVLALAAVGFFAAETFLPLLVQGGRGRSAIEAGVLISLGSISWTSGSLLTARRADPAPRMITAQGLVLMAAGVLLLLLLVALDWPLLVAYPAWILVGLGMGAVTPACTTVILDAARGPQAASITAASQLSMSLGTSAGAALAGVVAALGFGPGFAPGPASNDLANPLARELIDRGVTYAFVLALAFVVATLLLVRRIPLQRELVNEQVVTDQPTLAGNATSD